eukprot:GHVU01122442.1.p1 GENE.GHVU01122442.1~~GHVU01122442.1.p1  ORF type:complete len:121 (+),score=13.11 GHVU01122442.1:426-788(+)
MPALATVVGPRSGCNLKSFVESSEFVYRLNLRMTRLLLMTAVLCIGGFFNAQAQEIAAATEWDSFVCLFVCTITLPPKHLDYQQAPKVRRITISGSRNGEDDPSAPELELTICRRSITRE